MSLDDLLLFVRFTLRTETKSKAHGTEKLQSGHKSWAKEGKIAKEMSPTTKTGLCNRTTEKAARAFQDGLGPTHSKLKEGVNIFGRLS